MRLTRDLFYGEGSEILPKIQTYEEELNSGDPYPTDIFKTIRDVPLKKFAVGADDELLAAKVYELVVRGAEEDENLWRRSARVVSMEKEIERVPLMTPDDFAFKPWVRGTAARASGGSFWMVELDCSDDKGLEAVDVGLSSAFVKRRGFDAVEEALISVGQAAGRLVLQAIVAKYLADVSTSSPDMTDTLANWGADQYKSLVKMESLIAKNGMSPDVCLINPDEGYDMGIVDYFIRQDYSLAARGIPRDLHTIGSLYGRVPILRHRDVTAASMIMANSMKSMVVGIIDDLSISDYDDVRKGMVGAICSIQFDVKSAADAKGPAGSTNPCKGAWAVCTSA